MRRTNNKLCISELASLEDAEIIWLVVKARPGVLPEGIVGAVGEYRYFGPMWAARATWFIQIGPLGQPTHFGATSLMVAAGLNRILDESAVDPATQAVMVITDCAEYADKMPDPSMSLPLVRVHPEIFLRTVTILASTEDTQRLLDIRLPKNEGEFQASMNLGARGMDALGRLGTEGAA